MNAHDSDHNFSRFDIINARVNIARSSFRAGCTNTA